MADTPDKRIQLRESIHQLVVSAAAARCVTPASFIAMVVYDYLQARNELYSTGQGATHAEPSGAPAASPVEDKPKWQVRFDNMDAEDAIAYRDQVAYWLSEDQVPEDRLDTIRAELAYLETLHGTASNSVGDWMLDD